MIVPRACFDKSVFKDRRKHLTRTVKTKTTCTLQSFFGGTNCSGSTTIKTKTTIFMVEIFLGGKTAAQKNVASIPRKHTYSSNVCLECTVSCFRCEEMPNV